MHRPAIDAEGMPDIAAAMLADSEAGRRADEQLCMEVDIAAAWPGGCKSSVRTQMSEIAFRNGMLFQELGQSDAAGEILTVKVQGTLQNVRSLYLQIPSIIGAKNVLHRLPSDLVYGPKLELKFYGARMEEIPIGSASISVQWLKNIQKSKSGLSWSKTPKYSDIHKTALSLGKTPSVRKQSYGTVIPIRNFNKQPASLASINESSQKVETRENKLNLIYRSMNHGTENVRFNCVMPTEIQQMLTEQRAREQSNLGSKSPDNRQIVKSQISNYHREPVYSNNDFGVNYSKYGKCAVRVQGLDWRRIGRKELCNLFTNYGNIENALCLADGQEGYLCYCATAGVDNAIMCLDGLVVDGSEVILTPVSQGEMQDCISKFEHISFVPRKRFSSQGSGLPNKVNRVSRTLHVTFHHNSEDRLLSDSEILIAMSQNGQPMRVKRESSKKKRNMWFVEFLDVSTALYVLMNQHNQPFQGGTLRISFTKTL